MKKIKAKILFVPAESDLIFPPDCRCARRNATRRRAEAREVAIIEGDGGHLDGVLNVAKQGEAIRAFLSK